MSARVRLAIAVCVASLGILSLAPSCGVVDRAMEDGETTDRTDILAQFELESEPPSPTSQSIVRVVSAESPIVHPDPLELVGTPIEIASDTDSADLSTAIAKAFRDDGFRGSIMTTLSDGPGAIRRICEGDAHIGLVVDLPSGDASQSCARDLEMLALASDRLVVAAHPDNFWIGSISVADIPAVMSASSWNDVNDSWPRRAMTRYLPPLDSGEMQVLLASVGRNSIPATAGFPGAIFEGEVAERLRRVAADPAGVTVVPLVAVRQSNVDFVERPFTARDPLRPGRYPAERTMHIVVARDALASAPQLATLVAYFLNAIDGEAPRQFLVAHSELVATRAQFVGLADALELTDGLAPLLSIDQGQA